MPQLFAARRFLWSFRRPLNFLKPHACTPSIFGVEFNAPIISAPSRQEPYQSRHQPCIFQCFGLRENRHLVITKQGDMPDPFIITASLYVGPILVSRSYIKKLPIRCCVPVNAPRLCHFRYPPSRSHCSIIASPNALLVRELALAAFTRACLQSERDYEDVDGV